MVLAYCLSRKIYCNILFNCFDIVATTRYACANKVNIPYSGLCFLLVLVVLLQHRVCPFASTTCLYSAVNLLLEDCFLIHLGNSKVQDSEILLFLSYHTSFLLLGFLHFIYLWIEQSWDRFISVFHYL